VGQVTDRFQPPLGVQDQRAQQALSDVSRVLDAQPRMRFAPEIATAVSCAPGEIKRLSPRSGGQTAVLQAPSASNAGQSVALFVSGPGALTVAPVSGTINGASQLVFAAGAYSLQIFSDGERWLTPGLSSNTLDALAGAGLVRNGAALDVTGSTSIVVTGDQVTRAALTGDVTAAANGNATTIAASAVTNAKLANMAARTVKLRADSAGAGVPVDGTGAQLGEILRLATVQTDTSATGTIVTYTLAEKTNVVRFTAIAATTLRGATIPAEDGQIVVWENNDASGASVTFNNEDASAAAAGNRFRTPGAVNYVLAQAHRMITVYINQRWRLVAHDA
jgi:hypothetical protein